MNCAHEFSENGGLTHEIARSVASFDVSLVPQSCLAGAKTAIADTIGVLLAGQSMDPVPILTAATPDGDEATIFFGAKRKGSRDAALVNGTAAHVLDFDDVALTGHPSAVLVPTILAEGERLNRNGLDLIAAYIVGYECWAELSRREPDSYHRRGWHGTGVHGTIGAAAAAAFLARLPIDAIRHALAISASMASGVVANFGTMVKPIHAGRAAANGIDAARWAAAGIEGAPDALEHPAGLLAAISPESRVDRTSPVTALASRPALTDGISLKQYPTCYATHRAIDGVIALAQVHNLQPADVEEIKVGLSSTQQALLRYDHPQTAMEAKFSLQFAAAAALLDRKVGLAQMCDSYVRSPEMSGLMAKVVPITLDDPSTTEIGFSRVETVAIRTVDGQILSLVPIEFARGHARNPVSWDELRAKFESCASPALGGRWRHIFERLLKLEEEQSVPELMATLTRPHETAAAQPASRASKS